MARGSRTRGFVRNESGNVAVLYALCIVPILCVIGIAIDMNRSKNARLHVQDAMDAAVLSAAKLMQTKGETADVDDQVEDMFRANLAEFGLEMTCEHTGVAKNKASMVLTGSVQCTLANAIMPIFGVNELTFTRTSTAAYSVGKLEVAFMFDVSGSMKGQKLVDLQDAADKGLDILFDLPAAATGNMRVAMSTFATSLNAGPYFNAATNLTNPRSGLHDTNPNKAPAAITHTTSGTCVTERAGAQAFTDAPPAIGAWIPAKNDVCPVSTILPLTDSRADIDAALGTLAADGYTAGHIGIAWTWYLLSPRWAPVWPAGSDPLAYDAPNLSKVAILMTDGEFNSRYESSNGDTATQAKAVCAAMKAQGVQVFAVAFDAPSSAEALMTECASPNSFYAASNGAQLEAAYKAIAVRISKLRLAS